MNKSALFSVVMSMLAAALCSCQQSGSLASGGGSVGVRNYSDAVTHIGQVDPAYRAYFSAQNAANYSLNDQRKAYIAAAQVAHTPVRESDYRPSDVRKAKPSKNSLAKKSQAKTRKRTAVVVKKSTRRR